MYGQSRNNPGTPRIARHPVLKQPPTPRIMIASVTISRPRAGAASILFLLVGALVVPAARAQTAPSADNSAREDEVVTLAPFEVMSDKGTRGYGSTNALGGTRVNAPIADTPQSVISLNQEFLKDVNPTNFADALRFVSGVTKSAGEYIGDVTIRGITTQAIGFRDSVSDDLNININTGITLPDPIEVERLEVIKGPAGAIYGAHGFGGVINRVSKRPLETRRTEVGAEYTFYRNDEGFYRTTLDTTGPIDVKKRWLYRFLAAYQDGTNHTHGTYAKQTLIGTLEFRPTPQSAVWLRARKGHDRIFAAQDLFTDSQRNMPFNDLPKYAYVGNFFEDDQVDLAKNESLEVGGTLSFDAFGTAWHARILARSNDVTQQRRTYISSGGFFYKDGQPLRVGSAMMSTANATWAQARAAGYDDILENIQRRDIRDGASESTSQNFDLTGELELGPTRHRLLVYAGRSEGETFIQRFRENWIGPRPSLLKNSPTEVPPEQVLNNTPVTLAGEWTLTESEQANFAVQDNISLLEDRLILVGAYRYDSGTTGVTDYFANTVLPDEKTSHWTPSYGVVGKPRRGVSLFYNHAETFQPQGGVNQSGQRLRPLIGENDEFGVKLDLFQNRLVMTGSYFNMNQENAFLKVIFPDGTFDFVQVPLSETKGWEIDLAAQPIDNLTLLVSYQWIDAKTQNGLARNNVPQGGSYKAIGKYSFNEGPFKGFDLGLTFERINDSRPGDSANNFFLPGFELLGAFAAYHRDNWRLQLNIENLTDEWYIAGTAAQQFMRSGPPTNFKFSLRYVF